MAEELEEAKFLALDPGKSTGYAYFKSNGEYLAGGTIRGYEEAFSWFPNIPWDKLDSVIVEDFRLYTWKAQQQSWSKLETVKLIGAVEVLGRMHGVPVVLQSPAHKPIAYMWAGLTVPKNHDMSHETDAFVHGVYYLQKHGIRMIRRRELLDEL